ncbi:MAG TPA: C40 family peptidase [Niabella sp.]|jgi:cell wall-associated NlpC family hydrolase|nr:C40 family peptidase [Chitinophagaceae bacterium]HRN47525.1 C40 family peptidase [Niabella sp.]HRO84137.1 C40 family peptidase [Niabella sp.]HUN02068.1 C40 family peptidase [Niabella sp.]
MEYAIISVPAAPVRRKPSHRKEMTNQLLFGDAVRILKRKGKRWVKVESLYDGYKGWVTNHLITIVKRKKALQPSICLTGEIINTINFNGSIMHVPLGACLPNFENNVGEIGSLKYEYSGKKICVSDQNISKGELVEKYSKQWLNVPYLWGGKTILGVDCSGFAQMVFKMVGVAVLRDAWQQAEQGKLVPNLVEAQRGDLAFFDDKDEIVHVGILLGDDKIIHAAGKVRIDTITEKGIINSDTGKQTHQLKIIKRYYF